MKLITCLVAGATLLTTSGSLAATYDVLSIYVNTDSTDDVSARIDLSDQDGSPGFEHFESMTLARLPSPEGVLQCI